MSCSRASPWLRCIILVSLKWRFSLLMICAGNEGGQKIGNLMGLPEMLCRLREVLNPSPLPSGGPRCGRYCTGTHGEDQDNSAMRAGGEKSYAEKGRQMDILTVSADGLYICDHCGKNQPSHNVSLNLTGSAPRLFFLSE